MSDSENLLGETDDYPDLAHLPPKDRAAMRRLRDWLAASVWNPSQALAVLCGYDPEIGNNTCAADMAFLPGAYAFYGIPTHSRDPDDLRAMDAGLEAHLAYIRGLGLRTMSPHLAIEKTWDSRVAIPWLDEALADPVCRKKLPPELLKTSDYGTEAKHKTPRQVAGSQNSKVRWEADDARTMLLGIGRNVFEELKLSGFENVLFHSKGRWKGRLSLNDLAEKILAAIKLAAPTDSDVWPEYQSIKRETRKWLDEED